MPGRCQLAAPRAQGARASSSAVPTQTTPTCAALGKRAQLLAAGAVEGAAGRFETRRGAGERDRDPAGQVQSGEVVVVQFGRMHRLADEHRRRLEQVPVSVVVQRRQEVVAELQLDRGAAAHDRQPRTLALPDRAQQRHRLEPAAIVARGLQADLAHALGDVGRGEPVAAGAGLAPLHAVVGQVPDVGADPVLGHRILRGEGRARTWRGCALAGAQHQHQREQGQQWSGGAGLAHGGSGRGWARRR
jgi:hypothetical protein